MTATIEAEETAQAPFGIALNVRYLQAALKNGIAFSAKDGLRPILDAVYIEWEPGMIRFVSTDSYRLLVQELKDESITMEGHFLLNREDAEVIVKALPKQGIVALVFKDDVLVTKPATGATFEHKRVPGEFPNWKALIIDKGQNHGDEAVSLSPSFLKSFCSLAHPEGVKEWSLRVQLNGPKPARLDMSGTSGFEVFGLLMPVRHR